jgi:predicted secreted hydrolase
VAIGLVLASLAGACGSPILANPPVARPVAPVAASPATRPADPLPISLPRDDGPHERLTEWWYFTGHLRDAAGRRFGFEFVVFRAERGDFPVTWASHLALTDETRGRFAYAQRNEIGLQVDRSPRATGVPMGVPAGVPAGQPAGFALAIAPAGGDGPPVQTTSDPAWRMSGGSGQSRLRATVSPTEAREASAAGSDFGLDLELDETQPVLHDRDVWLDFGAAGGSYYYSRPRMPAHGTLTLGKRALAVAGQAWFDHQWGDFIAVGGGGWDWFAVNLADGTDLVLWLVRDADGAHRLVYGTLRRSDGTVVYLPAEAFNVRSTDRWTSPHSGAVYPAGWRIAVPGEGLAIALSPTVADQELDTTPTSGVVYWEGSQHVTASRGRTALSGEAYVELIGYAPALASPLPSPLRSPALASPLPSPAESAP